MVVSKIFPTTHFGFRKITVERPLRLDFQATPERIARLEDERAFANLATSKKRKGPAKASCSALFHSLSPLMEPFGNTQRPVRREVTIMTFSLPFSKR